MKQGTRFKPCSKDVLTEAVCLQAAMYVHRKHARRAKRLSPDAKPPRPRPKDRRRDPTEAAHALGFGVGAPSAYSSAAFMALLMALRFMAFIAIAFIAFFMAFIAIALFMAIALLMAAMAASEMECGGGGWEVH